MLADNQKIGVFLTGFGLLFTLLGVVLFFDRGFMAIGNIAFLLGVTCVIGFRKTFRFFFQKRKIRGTICFLGGIVLVIVGWAFVGLCIESFGFVNLFGDFFPIVLTFMRRLPLIGSFLNLPGIRTVVDKIVGSGKLPV
jgi:hypothetical protein